MITKSCLFHCLRNNISPNSFSILKRIHQSSSFDHIRKTKMLQKYINRKRLYNSQVSRYSWGFLNTFLYIVFNLVPLFKVLFAFFKAMYLIIECMSYNSTQ